VFEGALAGFSKTRNEPMVRVGVGGGLSMELGSESACLEAFYLKEKNLREQIG
jgi:hypothetical protein